MVPSALVSNARKCPGEVAHAGAHGEAKCLGVAPHRTARVPGTCCKKSMGGVHVAERGSGALAHLDHVLWRGGGAKGGAVTTLSSARTAASLATLFSQHTTRHSSEHNEHARDAASFLHPCDRGWRRAGGFNSVSCGMKRT